jgi:hypothetical protein
MGKSLLSKGKAFSEGGEIVGDQEWKVLLKDGKSPLN